MKVAHKNPRTVFLRKLLFNIFHLFFVTSTKLDAISRIGALPREGCRNEEMARSSRLGD